MSSGHVRSMVVEITEYCNVTDLQQLSETLGPHSSDQPLESLMFLLLVVEVNSKHSRGCWYPAQDFLRAPFRTIPGYLITNQCVCVLCVSVCFQF